MRDPSRIDRVIEELRRIWKKYPDLRLWQLFEYVRSHNESPADNFYLEDEDWETILKSL